MVLENSASWEPGHDISEHSELMPEIARGVPLIKVLGIGGGGSNAVARMYKDKLPVVEYYAVNTDAQHLFRCDVGHRLAIGQNLTRGLGSGALPDLGRQAAEESRAELQQAIQAAASNEKGLLTTATVSAPLSLATWAITGAAPVPVPPPMPTARKIMSAP